MRKVIGLTGRMHAGKDYVFEQLRARDSRRVVRFSFADMLRHEIEEALGVSIPALWQKPYSEEIRALLQWWGTDFRRGQDEDYWSNQGRTKIDELLQVADIVVVTDARFENEVEVVRSFADSIVVRVEASDQERYQRGGYAEDGLSITEWLDLPMHYHMSEIGVGIEADIKMHSAPNKWAPEFWEFLL